MEKVLSGRVVAVAGCSLAAAVTLFGGYSLWRKRCNRQAKDFHGCCGSSSSSTSFIPDIKKDEEEADRYVIPDPLPKHDMTLEELRKYDGKGPDKRVCIAILGRVYDCSKSYHFYGPEGTYRNFAGHDATRALAKFDVLAVKEEWDDVSDLSPSEMSSVEEWKEQFEERYDFVGRLVRSAEEIEEEEPPVTDDSADASKIAKEGGGGGENAQQPSKQASSESSEGSDLEVIKSEELAEQK